MPIALDPNQTIAYVLLTDRSRPAPQPTFLLRYLTCRQYAQVVKLYDQAIEHTDLDQCIDLLQQVIGIGVSGLPDGSGSDALTMGELWELARAVCEEPRLREREKKASALPSPSATAVSAAVAAESPASAPTPPAARNP